jgi:hypothetical protein
MWRCTLYFSSPWLLLLGIPLLQASENRGVKMTIRYGSAGISNQHTIYLQADRKRMEFRNQIGEKKGPRLVAITRCDLGQTFELNLETREYTSATYPPKPRTGKEMQGRALPTKVEYVSDKPTLRIEVTTTDTGERKEMFDRMARRVLTTRKQIPLKGSRSQPQESRTDGWYVDSDDSNTGLDLYQRLSCDRPEEKKGHSMAYLHAAGRNEPIDRAEFVNLGQPERGFALHTVTTTKGSYVLPDGTTKRSDFKNEVEITQLESGPLDPALFEIPPGFKQVARIERNPTPPASNSIEALWQRLKNIFSR